MYMYADPPHVDGFGSVCICMRIRPTWMGTDRVVQVQLRISHIIRKIFKAIMMKEAQAVALAAISVTDWWGVGGPGRERRNRSASTRELKLWCTFPGNPFTAW
jgi:hypothetical protein